MYYHIDQIADPAHVYVFLNGRPLGNAAACDTTAGWADLIVLDRHGLPVEDLLSPRPYPPLLARVHGRVTVVEAPAPPPGWEKR